MHREINIPVAPARPAPHRSPADPRAPDRYAERCCRLAREIVSLAENVAMEEIVRPSRSPVPICRARHIAMYLAHVAFQAPLMVIAQDFGRDRTTVAHAVRRIEDQRDEPDFDARLCRLERLAAACGALAKGGEIEDEEI
ncbi:hypothetical protein NPA31_002540 [Aurantimonas sp. MSK8Z-1]|uniref:helix-turn-helix domain-containing protein n=1 Tax=Mangrovibrevibacter kandeliae TaxID=2968473 RepID=UPI00211938FE|nr:helix-turn-helix domain-containing protein [Aurantimonas sp. MSK8Z-1]MCW4113842.1 hypothetical protein [Aurantimonas sp. MSK8Z-1]